MRCSGDLNTRQAWAGCTNIIVATVAHRVAFICFIWHTLHQTKRPQLAESRHTGHIAQAD